MKLGRPVVLLTGASGFVGRHIAPILQDNGWIVRRAVRRPSENADDILIPTIDAATDWRVALAACASPGRLSAHPPRPDGDTSGDPFPPAAHPGPLQLLRCGP